MYYRDLNLKGLREKLGLDFAHFTYKDNQCSCCYGPSDMASIHWRNREVIEVDDPRFEKVNYILFKNANNGSGSVTKNDKLKDTEYIEYQLESFDLVKKVCEELFNQVSGYGYGVLVPKNTNKCILLFDIERAKKFASHGNDYIKEEMKNNDYILLKR